MKTKHTPAPWKLDNKNEIIADNKNESLIAEVFDQAENWKANARLMSAAPELLNALQRLLNAFKADGKISPNMPIKISLETNGAAIQQAIKAISRARGTLTTY